MVGMTKQQAFDLFVFLQILAIHIRIDIAFHRMKYPKEMTIVKSLLFVGVCAASAYVLIHFGVIQ